MSSSRRQFYRLLGGCRLITTLLVAMFACTAYAEDPLSQAELIAATERAALARQAAVALAREGEVDTAYEHLFELYKQADLVGDAERQNLRFDLAVVASWAGQDQQVSDLLAGLRLEQIPSFVLVPYAKSLRNLRMWQESVAVYRYVLNPHLDDPEALYRGGKVDVLYGLALTLGDAGSVASARAALNRVDVKELSEAQLAQYFFSCGYLHERERDYLGALDCYNRGLRVAPENLELTRRRVAVASALGATQYAYDQIAANPQLLASEEKAQVALDTGAMRIRWSGFEYKAIDRSRDIRALIIERGDLETVTPTQARVRIYDDIVAHVGIAQMAEALAKARSLFAQGIKLEEFPAYVLDALGYAYMYEERPERAIRCFRLALQKLPDDTAKRQRFRSSVGLFYALSDAGHYAEVRELVAELRANEEPWERPTEKIWLPNNRFTDSVHLAALADAYREGYDEALVELDGLLSIAPANNQLRLSRAAVSRWRGWHDKSSNELARLPRDEEFVSKWVQTAHIGIETQTYPEAEQSVMRAVALDPRDKAVVDVQERWTRHNQPVLEVSATAGRSDGGQLGSESLQVDSTLYTAPFAHHYRAFASANYRYAEFEEGTGRDTRVGAGMEYRRDDWTLAASVQSGLDQFSGTGFAVRAARRVGDHWRHTVDAGINSLETPLRGVRQGVEGDLVRYGVRYRWHESRVASLAVAGMDFSDGNQREWADLRFRQRIGNWPKHKLAVLAGYYTSRNDTDQVAYFSPLSDNDVGVDFEHEWRPWARYERAFIQRVTLGVGSYEQKNFGTKGRWAGTLEHEWRLEGGWNVSYGLSYGRRPYDGIQEKQRSIFVSLRGHL